MPILLDTDELQVSQGWLTGWRVTAKETGKVFKPNRKLQIQIGFAWKALRSIPLDQPLRRICEDELFMRFAYATANPDDLDAAVFVGFSPEAVALDVVNSGLKRLAAAAEAFETISANLDAMEAKLRDHPQLK